MINMRANAAYERQVRASLLRLFPEFGDHPAAIAAVIRLHYIYGKGRLTLREHGDEIRAQVAAWESRVKESV